MEKEHEEILRKNRVRLKKDLHLDGVLTRLFAEKVLEQDMIDKIIKDHATTAERNEAFLALLPTRGKRAFDVFWDALAETGQRHLAELLTLNIDKDPPVRETLSGNITLRRNATMGDLVRYGFQQGANYKAPQHQENAPRRKSEQPQGTWFAQPMESGSTVSPERQRETAKDKHDIITQAERTSLKELSFESVTRYVDTTPHSYRITEISGRLGVENQREGSVYGSTVVPCGVTISDTGRRSSPRILV